MRLKDKVAVVVGAGQNPGETIGNGRATALLFAREGARVLAVDRDLESAGETAAMIVDTTTEGGWRLRRLRGRRDARGNAGRGDGRRRGALGADRHPAQ